MVKLICPIEGCRKSVFETAQPSQEDINKHLRDNHDFDSEHLSDNHLTELRKQQDKVWNQCYEELQDELKVDYRRQRQEWEEFAADPKHVAVPIRATDEDLVRRWEEHMGVDDDEIEEESDVRIDPEGRDEGFGQSTAYNRSLRTTQVGLSGERRYERLIQSGRQPVVSMFGSTMPTVGREVRRTNATMADVRQEPESLEDNYDVDMSSSSSDDEL